MGQEEQNRTGRQKKWLWIRLGLLLIGIAAGRGFVRLSLISPAVYAFESVASSLVASSVQLLIGFLVVFAWLGVSFWRYGRLHKPFWFSDPLAVRQPLLWVHLGAWELFGAAVGGTYMLVEVGSIAILYAVAFLSSGASLWLAMRLSMLVWRSRLDEADACEDTPLPGRFTLRMERRTSEGLARLASQPFRYYFFKGIIWYILFWALPAVLMFALWNVWYEGALRSPALLWALVAGPFAIALVMLYFCVGPRLFTRNYKPPLSDKQIAERQRGRLRIAIGCNVCAWAVVSLVLNLVPLPPWWESAEFLRARDYVLASPAIQEEFGEPLLLAPNKLVCERTHKGRALSGTYAFKVTGSKKGGEVRVDWESSSGGAGFRVTRVAVKEPAATEEPPDALEELE